jgi:hypothetical protein
MYSPLVSKQNLARIQSKLSFTLTPHSVNQIRHVTAQLDARLEAFTEHTSAKGKEATAFWMPQEREWITNEALLCKYDFRYWLTHYAYIKSNLHKRPGEESSSIILLPPNIAQRMVLQVWAEQEERQHPIMMMQLKARQLGVSTLTEMAIAHRVQFYQNVNALVASSTEVKSRKMSDMMVLCWEHQPFWLMPQDVRGPLESGELLVEFRKLNSTVTLQWGNKITGMARGETPDIVHLSEIPEWACDPYEAIDASLGRSFHPEPKSFMVWESTAKGMGAENWWYQKWKHYSEEYPKGTAKMRPLFLPWFIGTDVWPTRTWIAQHEHLLAAWEPDDETLLHARSAQRYVAETPLLARELGTYWEMPRIQMLAWEIDRQEAKKANKLNKFYEEMPGDPMEAFQTTNLSVFDVETIKKLDGERRQPLAIYAVTGLGIAERFRPHRDDIDFTQPKRVVSATFDPRYPLRYEFIPLKMANWQDYPHERLIVWEEPDPRIKYHFGVDTSYGIGQDSSVIEGMRPATVSTPAVQACEFATPYRNSMDLAPICLALGLYYSTMSDGVVWQPKFSIECMGNGETTQLQMKKVGYWNFHRWERYDNHRRLIQNKIGWFTNAWSRPILIDHINNAIWDRQIVLNSPWLINGDLKTLEKDIDAASARAARGEHDDRYIALAIAFVCEHIWDVLVKGMPDLIESRRRQEAEQREGVPVQRMDLTLPHPGLAQQHEEPDRLLSEFYRELQEEALDRSDYPSWL